MSNRNLITDYYQLTMAYAYFKSNRYDDIVYFDMFYRKNPDKGGYVISAGLDDVINFINNLRFSESDIEYLRTTSDFDEEFLKYLKNFKFSGDIYAVPDGTVVFPNEPLITVRANKIEGQIIETGILLRKNFASLITTKASRIVATANNRKVLEFGTRRAQGESAAVLGAKYAYLGGFAGTACVETGKQYKVPVVGTMAHSYIESFDTEYEAFLNYAKTYPNKSVFLVDTYDTLKSGVPNAIKVALEYLIPNGYRLKGIRLDSGDLAYLSIEARKMLDAAGLNDCSIVASNSLDEYSIQELIDKGAKIDSFGVGEKLITAKSDPVFGGVYKLVAIEKEDKIIPKIKISDNIEKIINPGYKKVYRFYDKETGYAGGDVIVLCDEAEQIKSQKYDVRELQKLIYKDGNLVYQVPTLEESRERCVHELNTIHPETRQIINSREYRVNLSRRLSELKEELLRKYKEEAFEVELHYQKKIGTKK